MLWIKELLQLKKLIVLVPVNEFAVTGNILGAYLGFERIPKRFVDKLELKDIIIELADDLYNDCKLDWYSNKHDEIWEHKYLYHDYILIKEKEK